MSDLLKLVEGVPETLTTLLTEGIDVVNGIVISKLAEGEGLTREGGKLGLDVVYALPDGIGLGGTLSLAREGLDGELSVD